MSNLAEQFRLLANDAFELWDNDKDMKVGKLLRAMTGLNGYRPDVDGFRADLVRVDLENERLRAALRHMLKKRIPEATNEVIEFSIQQCAEGLFDEAHAVSLQDHVAIQVVEKAAR